MRAVLPALIPLATAILAIAATFATGFDQRTALPPELESRFYGFFLDRYPLFAVAIVYGLTSHVVRIVRPGPAAWPRRVVGGGLAIALFLAACLHPTFGGVILRLAFASGGNAFLTQAPMPAAYAVGSALATLVFASALGLGALLIGNRRHPPLRWLRRLSEILVRTLTLWFALATLGLGHIAGFGIWPRRSLSLADALIAAALAVAAFLPHLCVNGLTVQRIRLARPDAAA